MSLERDSVGIVPGVGIGSVGVASSAPDPRSQLFQEMREQNFDLIRFASYRTACKLRYVQKKCNLHVIDIWNVIEAFRENALNTLEPTASVNVTRLETLVSSLYHNLNKRLPPVHQVCVESCSALLLNWLISAYSTDENVGKIRVFSIKVALATMCAGKLMDKLRYIFSQLSDGNGHLLMKRLSDYLREVLALPAAVYESPSFNYNDSLALSIFNQNNKVTVNDFLDTLMSDPGPPCLVWLPLLHRLASVENVVHPLACSACRRSSLTGLRYRCTRCTNYTLCQDCFWRGRVSAHHTNEHEVKEYAAYKSPSKQIGATLRKSFRCVPERARPLPRYPDQPERTLNLEHIVPPSPVPAHNGFPEYVPGYVNTGSLDSRSSRSTHRSIVEHLSRGVDDEHRLIARYAARLAHENRTMPRAGRSASLTPELGRSSSEGSEVDAARHQRELISQLEAKNREIMREIARLRRQQETESASGSNGGSAPPLVSELRLLRQRKDELETHLLSLQQSRKHLMHQLEGLMKMLKTQQQASPRSTPNSSPRSTKSPPLPGAQQPSAPPEREASQPRGTVRSAPQTPSLGERERIDMTHSLGGMESMNNDSRNFHQNQRPTTMGIDNRVLRSDLLYAADSVTNAMSTLVRELNSEGSDTEDTVKGDNRKQRSYEEDDDSDEPMPRPRHYLHDNNVQSMTSSVPTKS